MITSSEILSIDKENIQKAALEMQSEDLHQLVEWLSEKDDKLRYQAFLLLQLRSQNYADVYPFISVFHEKLKNENSYQRSIGSMLLAANTRWDNQNFMDTAIDDYLLLLQDEKPITIRQCIQSLRDIIPYKENLHSIITRALLAVNISSIKETMQKSVLLDILTALALIRKHQTTDEIENYIMMALSGGLLDKKAKKQIELLL